MYLNKIGRQNQNYRKHFSLFFFWFGLFIFFWSYFQKTYVLVYLSLLKSSFYFVHQYNAVVELYDDFLMLSVLKFYVLDGHGYLHHNFIFTRIYVSWNLEQCVFVYVWCVFVCVWCVFVCECMCSCMCDFEELSLKPLEIYWHFVGTQ